MIQEMTQETRVGYLAIRELSDICETHIIDMLNQGLQPEPKYFNLYRQYQKYLKPNDE